MVLHAFTVKIVTQPAAQIPNPKPKPKPPYLSLSQITKPPQLATPSSAESSLSLSLGAVTILGLRASMLTKTLTFAAAFFVFGDPIL
ncbi:hypothetical protein ACLB2K_042946 [Fragaria x ananassa]